MLLFSNITCRGPLGGQGTAYFTLKSYNFLIMTKKYQKFKSKLATPRPPNGPLHVIFVKSSISAFTGTKNYPFIFFCSNSKSKWILSQKWVPYNFFRYLHFSKNHKIFNGVMSKNLEFVWKKIKWWFFSCDSWDVSFSNRDM